MCIWSFSTYRHIELSPEYKTFLDTTEEAGVEEKSQRTDIAVLGERSRDDGNFWYMDKVDSSVKPS